MKKIKASAVICARKNSKGIKDKNLSQLNGKPLIKICIEQAIRCVEQVIVSSDSQEILDIAKSYNSVITIERPSDLAKDTTPKIPVLQHAIKEVEERGIEVSDIIYDLQATSPLREDESILNTFDMFIKEEGAENLISINKTSVHPSYNLVTKDGDSKVRLLEEPKEPVTGRNLLPETFLINGLVYVWRKSALLKRINNNIIGDYTVSYETEGIESLDIDTEDDLLIAKAIIHEEII